MCKILISASFFTSTCAMGWKYAILNGLKIQNVTLIVCITARITG